MSVGTGLSRYSPLIWQMPSSLVNVISTEQCQSGATFFSAARELFFISSSACLSRHSLSPEKRIFKLLTGLTSFLWCTYGFIILLFPQNYNPAPVLTEPAPHIIISLNDIV